MVIAAFKLRKTPCFFIGYGTKVRCRVSIIIFGPNSSESDLNHRFVKRFLGLRKALHKMLENSLVGRIRNDLEFSGGSTWYRKVLIFIGRPAFRVLFWYRIAHHFWKKRWPLIYHFANLRMSKFGCYIHPNASLGSHVKLAHPVGIVIGRGVIVQDECTIYQNVTIGGDGKSQSYPVVKRGVVVYAGATIIGSCIIGEDAVIGANSVVLEDIPSKVVAKGNPAKF